MLEAVPNVSEGRDAAALDAVASAFARGARLLDVHADPDHHRSVFTLVGSAETLVRSLVEGAAESLSRIDLRRHEGVHPRVGVVDVVPLVAIEPDERESARAAALDVAERLGRDLGIPVLLYAELGGGRRPAFFRRGGLEELERRIRTGELAPEYGPARIDPAVGVTLVGARAPLVAYNVDLATGDVAIARAVAAAVRESSGGMRGVQAIGLELARGRRIQVSMNIVDLAQAPLHGVLERVAHEAARHGVEIAGGELVGLVPESVLLAASAAGVSIPGLDASDVLERRAGAPF